jgi:hypothetical protein
VTHYVGFNTNPTPILHNSNCRFEPETVQLLKWYQTVFGVEMWTNVLVEVTFWKHSEAEVKTRKFVRKYNESIFEASFKKKLVQEVIS